MGVPAWLIWRCHIVRRRWPHLGLVGLGIGYLGRRSGGSKLVSRVPAILVIEIPLAGFLADGPVAALIILEQLAVKLARQTRSGIVTLGLQLGLSGRIG